MEKQTAYIVGYSIGSYDDFFEIEKFVTLDKELALSYEKKYNELYSKVRLFYELKHNQFIEELKSIDLDKRREFGLLPNNMIINRRWSKICDHNLAFIKETILI